MQINDLVQTIRRRKINLAVSLILSMIMTIIAIDISDLGIRLNQMALLSLLGFIGSSISWFISINTIVRNYLYFHYRDVKLALAFSEYLGQKKRRKSAKKIFLDHVYYHSLLFQVEDDSIFVKQLRLEKESSTSNNIYQVQEEEDYWYWMAQHYYRKGDLAGLQDAYQHLCKLPRKKQIPFFQKRLLNKTQIMEIMCFLLGDETVPVPDEKIFTPKILNEDLKRYYWSGMIFLKKGNKKQAFSDLKYLAENGRDYWDAKEARKILDANQIPYQIKEIPFEFRNWVKLRKVPFMYLAMSSLWLVLALLSLTE